jgi:hypothetical protein
LAVRHILGGGDVAEIRERTAMLNLFRNAFGVVVLGALASAQTCNEDAITCKLCNADGFAWCDLPEDSEVSACWYVS